MGLENEVQKNNDNVKNIAILLASLVEARDAYIVDHSHDVADIAKAIAKKMGLSAKKVEQIYLAGLLHDIGKVAITDNILHKPGKLSTVEYDQVKQHPEIGYHILQTAGGLFGPIIPMVRYHHERWDGGGYPLGLKGGQIPIGAAVIGLADAYHAMVSNRAFRSAYRKEKALEVIEENFGTQFHPKVAAVFLEHFNEIESEIRVEPLIKNIVTELLEDNEQVSIKEQMLPENKILGPYDYFALYREILELVYDAILIYDEDHIIIDWNEKAEKMYGYSSDEFDYMPVKRLGLKTNIPSDEQLSEAGERRTEILKGEHYKKDGTKFPVEVITGSFIQARGDYTLSIVRDMSSHKVRKKDPCQSGHISEKSMDKISERMLKAIPYSAYIINEDREVIATNKPGHNCAIDGQKKCHDVIFRNKEACPFCQAALALEADKHLTYELTVSGDTCIGHWLPLGEGRYLHFFKKTSLD